MNNALSASDTPHRPVVLDAAALTALRELDANGGLGIMMRVLAAFEKSLARMLQQLQEQLLLGDAHTVFAIAHTLKAPAASCGALALSQMARDVELRYRSKPGADTAPEGSMAREMRADITRLTTEGEAVLVAVRAMLQD
jgi:HPt (histidine-containing phosphotransfer) domain-containing protein